MYSTLYNPEMQTFVRYFLFVYRYSEKAATNYLGV